MAVAGKCWSSLFKLRSAINGKEPILGYVALHVFFWILMDFIGFLTFHHFILTSVSLNTYLQKGLDIIACVDEYYFDRH